MLYINNVISRGSFFWQGVNKESVRNYIKELKKEKKELKQSYWKLRDIVGIKDSKIRDVLNPIDKEIEFCKFYLEYSKKSKKKNFNKWAFIKKENRTDLKHYQPKHDAWIRQNGKIKVVITIDRIGMMTAITLSIENNSEHTHFTRNERGVKETTKHLKNEERIKEHIEELKLRAEELFKEHEYPYCCFEKGNMDFLKQLLKIQ